MLKAFAFAVSITALTSAMAMTLPGNDAPLTVPVSVLSAPKPSSNMMQIPGTPAEAPPATPAARMPQYQLHHLDRIDNADGSSPNLRYVLALPGQPVLVETAIFIDGNPFRQSREDRVQQIMKFVANPAAYKAEKERVAAAARAEAEARAAAASAATGFLDSISSAISDFISGDAAETPSTELTPEAPKAPETKEEPRVEEPTPGAAAEDKVKADAAPTPESETPTDTEEPKTEESKKEDVPAGPKYASPATIYDRIDRYMNATKHPPDADEVRWLLTNWVDGPVLLFLNDNFQRFRADQKPVFKILDRDRDGKVSAEELAQAVHSFQECDLNRNDIVEATELAEVANDPRDKAIHASEGKLVFRLPDAATASVFYRRLAARYADATAESPRLPRFDTDNDGTFSADELKQLREGAPDIRLRVEFNSNSPAESRLTVEGFGEQFARLKDTATLNASSVTLNMDTVNLEFLAVQSGPSDQISIGSVNDGYAMLPELDPNNDGRFSIRELRQLNERLSKFDLNADGQMTPDEEHPTIRICIGLGPTAHQSLALLRNTTPTATSVVQSGPEWFREMDKNNDYDLTRKEFPGTDEQFATLDKDSDSLISAEEANAFEP